MTPFLEESQIEDIYQGLTVDLEEEIDKITSRICEYCNTTFELVTRTNEKYDSRSEIQLVHRPIHSVTSISDDGDSLTEDAYFFVYDDKVALEYPSQKKKAILITYKSGYSAVPQTVKDVALDLARLRAFKLGEGSLLFYKSQKTEERDYEIGNETEEDILSRLTRWVQPLVKKRGAGPLRIGYMNSGDD